MTTHQQSSTAESSAADTWHDLSIDDADLCRLLDAPLPSQDLTKLRTAPHHAGFDNNMADSWLYPSNYPERAYQFNIVQGALYQNTLVVLPTGLGKTFIAAVVMYNLYRWYPTGKIIFMAPTRPLVAQQIEACQKIMPFPAADTVEMTGKSQRVKRIEMWQTKRVFFATPQVVQSDIVEAEGTGGFSGFPFDAIKLIVVDEAHRAKGRYAYVEVVQAIAQKQRFFRVLALSATPGRTMDDVAEVVRNLFISHLEVRCDNSLDVLPYVHQRSIRTIVVPLDEEIKRVYEELQQIIDPYLRQLIDAQVLSGSLTNINRNFLLFEQRRFNAYSRQRQRHPQQAAVNTNFAICISLFHALELLERHGLRVFVNNFEEDEEGKAKFVLNMDRRLRDLVQRLREELGPNPFDVSAQVMVNGKMPEIPSDLDFGHPKFEQARKVVREHFEAHPDSRAIVFCEYRESVMLMYRLLLQHSPQLRPRCFVGQGGTSGPLRALTQKQQIQIMHDFRAGKSNILVATSIGEEGIDVGEVELIVCFDIQSSNPQRLIQRIGRTGRKKHGYVVMLATEGREQQLLKEVLAQKDTANRKLIRSAVVKEALYKQAPRLVPTEFNPKCVRAFIKPPEKETKTQKSTAKAGVSKSSTKSKEKEKEKSPKNTQDLRNFFKKPAEVIESTQSSTVIEKSVQNFNDSFKEVDSPLKAPKLSIDSKRLRRLGKLFKSTGPLLTPSERIQLPLEQLRSTKLSVEGKLFILKKEPLLIREALENMRVIEALQMETDTVAVEENEIRSTYALIEKLLGGSRSKVEQFLDDVEMEEIQRGCFTNTDDLFDVSDREFDTLEREIFAGLSEANCEGDNYDYIVKELEKTNAYQQFIANESQSPCKSSKKTPKKTAESMVYETLVVDNEESNVSNVTNKYQSYCQWDDFAKLTPTNKSTPLQGPLVKAFQRQQRKENNNSSNDKGFNFLQRLTESREDEMEDSGGLDDVIFVPQTEPPVFEISGSSVNLTEGKRMERDKFSMNRGSIKENSRAITTLVSPKKEPHSGDSRLSGLDLNEAKNSSDNSTVAKRKEKDFTLKEPRNVSPLKEAPVKPNTEIVTTRVTPEKEAHSVDNFLTELDLDLDDFMEPFPEEITTAADSSKAGQLPKTPPKNECANIPNQSLTPVAISNLKNLVTSLSFEAPDKPLSSSQKENAAPSNLLEPSTSQMARQSPDLFEQDHTKTPVKNAIRDDPQNMSPLIMKNFKTPTKQKLKASPSPKSAKKYTKSPSVFELYMKNTRGRGKLPTLALTKSTPNVRRNEEVSKLRAVVSVPTQMGADESVIGRQRSSTKRKFRVLSDSSDEEVGGEKPKSQTKAGDDEQNAETECDEIAETQMPTRRNLRHQRKKQRHLHAFIDHEAAVSGSDLSEDEREENTELSRFDSIVVSSGHESEGDCNATQMQAHYLQSLKSPRHARGGAFKIPQFRVFNDQSHIYSQPPIHEPSQYVDDSFVVQEDDVKSYSEDVSLCPLERAERILKARRRAKRNKRRIIEVLDSSDEEGS